MKRNVLLFLFLCAATMGMAQTMVNTDDSTFSTSSDGSTIILLNTSHFTYDSACRISTITYQYYDPATQLPTTQTKYLYEYNPDGDVYRFIIQRNTSGTFENTDRYTDTYTTAGYISSQTGELWDGTQWIANEYDSLAYNEAGDRTLELYQRWDNDKKVYVNTARYTNLFDTRGNEVLYRSESWDTTANVWVSLFEYINTYDDNGFKTSDTTKSVSNVTQLYGVVTYTSYYNDNKGLADSSVRVNVPEYNYTKIYYTYFSNSTSFYQLRQYQYDVSNTLYGGYRYTYFHDSSSSVKLDSIVYELLVDSASNTYEEYGNSYSKYTYNPDHSIISIEQRAIGYYSDGTVYYNYLYRYQFGYAPCQSVLPIMLISFTGIQKNNNAVLQWKTTNETNTSSFGIQRSADGIHFITIGNVKAAGNSSVEKNYAYTDANISQYGAAKLYYRLAQQDINGSINYSRIAELDIINGKLTITLSPNPVRNSINIYSPSAIPKSVIRIADISGVILYTSHTNIAAGGKLTIDASAFATGMYFVTVQSLSGRQVFRIVKE